MIEKDQSLTTSRTRTPWRSRTSCSTHHRSTRSQLSRAAARSDCELLPYHFPKHFVEKFNVTRIHLANYSPTLWLPGHRRTIYRFFFLTYTLPRISALRICTNAFMAFVEDSLPHANRLTHHGEHVPEDEELTPTLENFVVLTWLRLIHPNLPRLVKQCYGTELTSRTLASIKPEISQALNSLLEKIRASDDAKILRAAVAFLSSRLDYCNSLLYGILEYQTMKLQRVVNASARLIIISCAQVLSYNTSTRRITLVTSALQDTL